MKQFILFVFIVLVGLSSCMSSMTLAKQYPIMYEEKPVSIAVMPPINQTVHAEAKDVFYTTMYMPLCEKGYYVYSPYLTMEMFQQESAYDAEQFLESDLDIFYKVLGADAVMFTIIKDWKRNTFGGMLTVNIEYVLRSTRTGRTLYSREGLINVNMNVSGGGSPIGALVGMLATIATTAMADKVIAGRKCNAFVLSDMPAGKYSPLFEKDATNPAGKKFIKATVR